MQWESWSLCPLCYKDNHPSLGLCKRLVASFPSLLFHLFHLFHPNLPLLLHQEPTYGFGFFNLDSSSLVRQLPIFLRTLLCSSIALNIFCAISSLIGAAIVAWEGSLTWNSSSWCVFSILTKRLPFFSRIQIGVGTCFLDFSSAMVPEKKSHFHWVHIPFKRFLLFLDVLRKSLSPF